MFMPQLTIKWGNRETRFAVTAPNVDIGRSDDNLLQIKDVKVSRYHCKIVRTPLGFLLSDSESSNGTFLNGKRVERTLLHNNDAIKIGNVEMVFSESDSVRAENNGPMVISSGQPADNASVGEVTTVINIQEENDSAARNNSVTVSVNSGVKNGGNGISNGATAGVLVAKRVEPAGKSQNGVAKPANGAVAAKPVVAQRVINPVRDNSSSGNRSNGNKVNGNVNTNISKMESNVSNGVNNQVLQNGSGSPRNGSPAPTGGINSTGKPTGTPPPRSGGAQPVRPVAPQSRPGGTPKPQSGVISRLTPPRNNSSRKISGSGQAGRSLSRPDDRLGRQVEATAGPAQPKKNKNILYIIGGAALILIVIIAFAASSGSNKKAEEDNLNEIKSLKQADELYEKKDYSEALNKYEAFLKEFKTSKNTDNVKDKIKKIKERDEKEKESKPKLAELKRKEKDYPSSKYPELLKEINGFIKEYSDVSPVIIQEAKIMRDKVNRVVASSGENEVNILFNKALGEANKLRDKKDYDGAIAKLKSFLKENPSLNDRQENTIRSEIKAIEKEKGEKSEKK